MEARAHKAAQAVQLEIVGARRADANLAMRDSAGQALARMTAHH
ncbi:MULTISPECIES: hypothetical protein [unclassified Streptomyces]|nr:MULTISPECIES: hypothetical protein [unclassified Streptomyces]MCX5051688.1 hypothetical protein [Streptomyces sp. NBC_00474]MCX5062037.1 hypothetical protein [Streptomyces sp. NBC_00452]MCX5249579.1 hypothetical protein [Streptomyces sp. NBC_00201]MCX5292354.1 hypothetical protein [Streptomyces sp. NBC_00183]